jgi:hypothetical protein
MLDATPQMDVGCNTTDGCSLQYLKGMLTAIIDRTHPVTKQHPEYVTLTAIPLVRQTVNLKGGSNPFTIGS